MQTQALADDDVPDANAWRKALSFMSQTVSEALKSKQADAYTFYGPSTTQQWMYWSRKSNEQRIRSAIRQEIDSLIAIASDRVLPHLYEPVFILKRQSFRRDLDPEEMSAIRSQVKKNTGLVSEDTMVISLNYHCHSSSC